MYNQKFILRRIGIIDSVLAIYKSNILQEFKKPTRPLPYICAVTNRPAKYKDPLTGLPYASPFAFKVIRDQYNKFLLEQKKDIPEVAEWLSQFVVDS